MKFPCDICEKIVCIIVCDKFTEYAKAYPKSGKVKERRAFLREVLQMDCPWIGREGCRLHFNKSCVTKGVCRDLERILSILKKKTWNKNEGTFIAKAFKSADNSPLNLHGWNRLLLSINVDPKNIKTRIGFFLMQKCREMNTCSYKPLLPENVIEEEDNEV